MKKLLALLLCLCLPLGAWAEAVRIDPNTLQEIVEDAPFEWPHDPDNWDWFFRSRAGRISFTLPAVPEVIPEEDLSPSGSGLLGWTDKVQLYTYTDYDGEFMAHIGDLSPALEAMRAAHPGEEEAQYQLNALINLARFYLGLYDGEIVGEPETTVLTVEGRAYPEARFSYRYPDDPDTEYRGRGLMDGNIAVLLMAQADPDSLRILEDLHPATQAEVDAFDALGPVVISMGEMEITFPLPPDSDNDEVSEFYDVFTPGYAYFTAEYMPVEPGDLPSDDDGLLEYAQATGELLVGDGTLASCAASLAAQGVALLEGVDDNSGSLTPFSDRRDLTHIYITSGGLYILHGNNTPEGMAFLDSAAFPGAKPLPEALSVPAGSQSL